MDPELAALYTATFAHRQPVSLGRLTELREQSRLHARDAISKIPASVEIAEHYAPSRSGGPGVRLLMLRPRSGRGSKPTILHMHGGAFMLGCPDAHATSGAKLATELDCVFMSVDYRLAPETPFPGAIEDCYDAVAWVHENADTLGVDPRRIVLAGESAGGGLAASLALLIRDRERFAIAHLFLTYPMLDDRTGLSIPLIPNVDRTLSSDCILGWQSLLAGQADRENVSPYAAAARARDLSRLPPTFIAIGALDPFVIEGMSYASRLAAAGVDIELHVYPGAFHGFDLSERAAVSQRFRTEYLNAVRRAFAASPPAPNQQPDRSKS